jgi:hypothetical protein
MERCLVFFYVTQKGVKEGCFKKKPYSNSLPNNHELRSLRLKLVHCPKNRLNSLNHVQPYSWERLDLLLYPK